MESKRDSDIQNAIMKLQGIPALRDLQEMYENSSDSQVYARAEIILLDEAKRDLDAIKEGLAVIQ